MYLFELIKNREINKYPCFIINLGFYIFIHKGKSHNPKKIGLTTFGHFYDL